MVVLTLIFGVGIACASDLSVDNSTYSVEDTIIDDNDGGQIDKLNMNNDNISEMDDVIQSTSISNESTISSQSDEIIVEDWDDLQYYCSLKDKNYVLRLKENTNYYPMDPSDSAYQIVVNNNVTIRGNVGAYIGDTTPNAAPFKYTAIVVPDNSKIGIHIDGVHFKWLSTNYNDDGVFLQMGGNVNNTIENCMFYNLNTNVGHSCVVHIKRGDALLRNCSFVNITTDFGCVSIFDPNERNAKLCTAARMVIDNCYFENNYARTEPGCVNNCGITVVKNSTFYKNRSFWWAGAIHTHGGANTTIYDSLFEDNVAGWNGGALYTYSYLQVYNTTFRGNNCTTNNGGGVIGACYYITNPHIFIDGCLFENNENLCWGLDELSTTGTGRGGAISIMDKGDLCVFNSVFIKNAASIGSAICAVGDSSYGSPDVKIVNNTFIDHTRVGNVIYVRLNGGDYEVHDNNYFNNTISFSSFELVAYEPNGDETTFHVRASLENPSYYDADILERSEYDVYVGGVFVKRVVGDTFTLNISSDDVVDVYVVSCINNQKSNSVSVGVPKEYIYVSKQNGDNSNNGLSRDAPVKTLQRAINLARNCQNILIIDGLFEEYDLFVSYDLTITVEDGVEFVSKNLPHFLFDASGATLTLKNVKINGLKMSGDSNVIVRQTSGLLVLDNCTVCNNNFDNLIDVDSLEVINSLFENNTGSIITNGFTMSNTLFINNKDNTSLIKTSTDGSTWQIHDSKFINNNVGTSILEYTTTFKTLKITNTLFDSNSVFGDAYASCIYIDSSSLLNVMSCVFVNNDVGSPVIYKKSLKSNVNVKDSVFLNNSQGYVIDADAGALGNVVIDYNWWGNCLDDLNVSPNVNSSVIGNWIFLNVSANNTVLQKNELALVVFDFNNVVTSDGIVSGYDASDFADISFKLDAVNLTDDKGIVDLANGMGSTTVMLNGRDSGVLNFNYNIISSFIAFNFTRTVPDIIVNMDNVTALENASVSVFLPADASGNITFYVLNTTTSIFMEITSPDINVVLPRFLPGLYNLSVVYSGDDDYAYKEMNMLFNVSKCQSSVNVSVGEIKYGENVVLTITVLDDATGNVSVIVNDVVESVVLIENKTFTYVVGNIKKGDNKVKVVYNGDVIYSSSSDEVDFEAGKQYSNIIISVDDADYKDNVTVSLLFNSNATGNVTVEVDGVVARGVLENGKCMLVLKGLSAGDKKLVVNYSGDEDYYHMTNYTAFKINKITVPLTILVNDVKIGQDVNVEVIVESGASGNVTFTLGNQNVVRTLSRVGKTSWVIPDLDVDNYTVYAVYNGDNNYLPCDGSAVFEVSGYANPQWPMEGYTISNTGVSPYAGGNNYELSWIIANDIITNIVIDSNGNVLFVSNNVLFSYDANQSLVWNYTFWSSDAVGGIAVSRDVVIVPKSGDKLYFFNQTSGVAFGSNIYQGSSIFAPVVDEDCNVYIASELQVSSGGYNLVVVPYSAWIGGGIVKTIDLGKSMPISAPVVMGNGYVAVATGEGLKVVDTVNGLVVSTFNVVTSSRPVASSGGIIYCLCNDSIVAFNIYGKLWEKGIAGAGKNLVLDDDNGYLYSVDANGSLYCYDVIDGDETLLSNVGSASSAILMGSDGLIYFGCEDATFNIVDGNGVILNKIDLGLVLSGIPVMDNGGRIYSNTANGSVVCLDVVRLIDSGLNVSVNDCGRGNVEIIVATPNNISGVVSISIDGAGVNLTWNASPLIYDVSLGVGEHDLVVNYNGDDVYASCSIAKSFSIDALATRFDNVVYSGDSLVAVIVDANGDVVSGADIFYSVNGVESKTVSDLNGSFSINGLSDSVVVIRFDGVGVLSPCNISLSLKDVEIVKSGSVFVGGDFKQYVCDYAAGERGGWYKLQLKDTNGNVLANKHVSISYEGILVNKTTDKNGFVGLQVSLKKAGTYGFVFAFLGDENYTACMAVHKVKILKKSTKLIAKAKAFKAKAKTKKYTVTLKTIKGSSANGKTYLKAGKKITLKLNGKTYTAKTNSKGKATFKLKITKKGKFTAKITFAGDNSMYKKSTAKTRITIK